LPSRTYQQKPCEGGENESSVNVPAAPQAPGAGSPRGTVDTKGAPAAPTVPKTEPSVLTFLVQKYQCDLGHPEIARQTKANYDLWRERNAQEIVKVESSAEYRALLDEVRKTKNPSVTSAMLDKVCAGVVQRLDQEGRAADPRRQTTTR
jgi:hypothetical protein